MHALPLAVLDGPMEWLAEWRIIIIIVVAFLMAWGMWWSDSMRSSSGSPTIRRRMQLSEAVEDDLERRQAIELARSSVEAATKKPLSLEEEIVAIHNIGVAQSQASGGSMH